MTIVDRDMRSTLHELAASTPVVTLTGPRQSGKTTLIQQAFPKYQYQSLEDPDTRILASTDPRSFLNTNRMILDEIQKVPELMSYIQGMVDKVDKPGMFILSGSQNLALSKSISQSLAGRTSLLTLLPFNQNELNTIKPNLALDDTLFHGFYPRNHHHNLNPTKAYKDYFETYIQRDLREHTTIKDLLAFQRFVKLCAGRIGSIFSASSLSNEVGVSVPTIQSWISVLNASYITFFLEPYYANIGKRLIKSPKLYFYDVGLASYLLGIEHPRHIQRDPLRGNLFENLVVVELLKYRMNAGLDSNIYFYRDSNGNEVDVVIRQGRKLVPVEIKNAATFTADFIKGIKVFKKHFPKESKNGFVVYSGPGVPGPMNTSLVNYANCAEIQRANHKL